MSVFTSRSYLDYFRFLMAGVLGVAAICIVATTYHWPLQWDAQVMHYINFLMDRGLAPYREITDMNMPGAYLTEGWAMRVFGGGDLAWRMYDFALMGLMCASMVLIALPYDWVAGLFAGVMFGLAHVSEGPMFTGQRDEQMTALIVVGYALLFEALRRRRPWMLVPFGLCLGMASAVKPTVAPLGVVLLAMVWWTLRKRGEAAASYVWSGIAGAGIATAIVFEFLFHYHAAGAFFDISRRLTPYYAGLSHTSLKQMLRVSVPRAAVLMLPFGLVVAVADRQWKNWERWALLLGVVFGAFSYFVQGKGYPYHRYALTVFLLLWLALELTLAMRKQGWVRVAGFAGMAMGVLITVPMYVHRVLAIHPVNQYTESLESDLTRLGGDQLQRKVQCLDMVDGCLNALYHLKLVQNTGATGDVLFFVPGHNPVAEYYRNEFWDAIHRDPPSVIVLSNEWFDREKNFDKVNEWPKFAAYLTENYDLAASRKFDREEGNAYRIYVRKGVVLPPL